MASYVEQVLTKDEHVVYQGHTSLWSQSFLIFAGFLLIFVFGLGLLLWLAAYVKLKTTELAITNKRVIAKFGFVSRRTVELNLSRVESIQVDQSLFGRVLNYGTLVISGAGNPQAPIPGISDPIQFRKAFVEAQELAAPRPGVS